jgi:putative zinc finger/helix-turn-helix YgiT family protein
MFNQLTGLSDGKMQACECCGAQALHSDLKTEYFNYIAESGEIVQLSARVPVWSCDACGDSFTDGSAEDLRHEAVCRHLGRLTPSELRDLRENFQCTQAEWAKITGLGVASIKRWESGSLIQSLAFDRYLRLLRNRDTFRELKSLDRPNASEKASEFSVGIFRTEISATASVRASVFQLRPAAQAGA